MFKTIVWATDGSESADRALELAAELAATPGAKLFAVHAVEHFAGGRSSGYPVRVDEDDLEASIRRQIESIREDGVDASFEVVPCPAGRIPHAVADYAAEVDADLIVSGTRGHSGLAGALLGSVAQGLLHTAPCPVLTVPPTATRARKDETVAVAGA